VRRFSFRRDAQWSGTAILLSARRGETPEVSTQRTLDGELACLGAFRDAVNLFKKDLADRHTLFQADLQGADVPDFQSDGRAEKFGIVELFPKSRVDGRGGDMDAQPDTRQAALALDTSANPRGVGELDLFLGPA
jgi:hypothetical protein